MPYSTNLEEESSSFCEGARKSAKTFSFISHMEQKTYSASGGMEQTLSPLSTGTNPQQLGEGKRKNPSSLKGEAEICPEHRTKNGGKGRTQRLKSHPQDPTTQGLPKTKV